MFNGKIFFNQPVKDGFSTYDNTQKIETGQRSD